LETTVDGTGGATHKIVESSTTVASRSVIVTATSIASVKLQAGDDAPSKPRPDTVSTVPPAKGVERGLTETREGEAMYWKLTPLSKPS